MLYAPSPNYLVVCLSQDGETALHKASYSGSTWTAQLLIERGINVNAQNKVSVISQNEWQQSRDTPGVYAYSISEHRAIWQ